MFSNVLHITYIFKSKYIYLDNIKDYYTVADYLIFTLKKMSYFSVIWNHKFDLSGQFTF